MKGNKASLQIIVEVITDKQELEGATLLSLPTIWQKAVTNHILLQTSYSSNYVMCLQCIEHTRA